MKKEFSERIKILRSVSNLTQTEFANKINVTQAALSAYEKGSRYPTYETLMAISNEFNVSVDWICGISNKMSIGYNTYSDVFCELVKICSIKYEHASKNEDDKLVDIDLDSDSKMFGRIVFNDANVYSFLESWIQIYSNYKKKLIDDDIYNMWLERELKKYNFEFTGLPECFS